jgi:hydrogenase/urease accessory protein HupE
MVMVFIVAPLLVGCLVDGFNFLEGELVLHVNGAVAHTPWTDSVPAYTLVHGVNMHCITKVHPLINSDWLTFVLPVTLLIAYERNDALAVASISHSLESL